MSEINLEMEVRLWGREGVCVCFLSINTQNREWACAEGEWEELEG